MKHSPIIISLCCFSMLAYGEMAPVSIENQTSGNITVINVLDKNKPQQNVAIPSNTSMALPHDWKNQTDPKHPWFKIQSSDGKELCAQGAWGHGDKKSPGFYVVTPSMNCQFNPEIPVAVNPIIDGIAGDVTLSPGATYSVQGTVANPADVSGAPTVTIDTSKINWFNLNQNTQGNIVQLNGQGTVPQTGPNEYSYTIQASNDQGGSTSKTINVHVSAAQPDLVPRTISAWIYDDTGTPKKAAFFASYINAWNNEAQQNNHPENKITELYPYGTDMEIYLPNLETYYIQDNYNVDKAKTIPQTYGPIDVYANQKAVPDAAYISPIVDGRIDTGYLKEFNDLDATKNQPQAYADLLAQQFCLDNRVNSLQIDVEPLDFTLGPKNNPDGQSAQVAFYTQLSKDFAGENDQLNICQDKDRFLSVFTFANKIIDGATQANQPRREAVLNLLKQSNFEVIDSLYDIPPGTTQPSTPAQYKTYVKNEIESLVAAANIYNFNFKFGIPASCSFHECEPGNQVQYVQYALEALGAVNKQNPELVCNNPHFKGLAIWAFDFHDTTWEGRPISIKPPEQAVVDYITQNASHVVGCPLNLVSSNNTAHNQTQQNTWARVKHFLEHVIA